MELKEAMRLGLLWDAGKMVGGDAYEAAAVLAKQVEALQADAERYRFIRKFDETTAGKVPECMFDENGEMLWDSCLDAAIDAARRAE